MARVAITQTLLKHGTESARDRLASPVQRALVAPDVLVFAACEERMGDLLSYIPYCGTPPLPQVLWSRWNLDPVLMVVLVVLAVACGRHLWVQRATIRTRVIFATGWLALALALVSPLCNLSIALFSARVGQHMWLVLVAAPLIAASRPTLILGRQFAGRRGVPLARRLTSPLPAAALFGLSLWFWHLPRPYQATFESHLAYWLMHVTLTGSAVLLWEMLFNGARRRLAGRLFAGFATLLHMGLLGAIITLAPRLLYPVHALTTEPWGLNALEDQQLGGLIMWVPGCTALALVVLAKVRELLIEPEAKPIASLSGVRSTPRIEQHVA